MGAQATRQGTSRSDHVVSLNPDRIAFLRAIATAAEDDTPRLVYADWLDEHGTTDADHARAEFIRISCRLKPKARITKAEQEWLAANWQRPLPVLVARLTALGWKPESLQWTGRRLKLWVIHRVDMQVSLELEFWRGFVRDVEYVYGFDEVAAAVVADEPLARHGFKKGSLPDARRSIGGYRLGITALFCFGRAVWDRLEGFESVTEAGPDNPVKWYEQPGNGPAVRQNLYRRVHDTMAAAMTARAREQAGWPDDLPTLG